MRRYRAALLWVALAAVWATPSRAERILVFTASSMTDVMGELAESFRRKTGTEAVLSFAGSGALARQIDAGAPADVYVSANEKWIRWSQERKLLDDAAPVEFARNRLVIAARNEVENWANAEAMLSDGRFAMGDPGSTPAGAYARQALVKRGLWETVKDNAVFGETVRVALKRVALGEVGAAIVYETDAAAEPAVRAIFTYAESDHDPIIYYAAATASAKSEAKDFVAYLASPEAGTVMQTFGFTPIPAKD